MSPVEAGMSREPSTAPCHVLAISAFDCDSAACLLRDGEVIAAGSEDRFARVNRDASFSKHAVDDCLSHAGRSLEDVDCIGFVVTFLVGSLLVFAQGSALAPSVYTIF